MSEPQNIPPIPPVPPYGQPVTPPQSPPVYPPQAPSYQGYGGGYQLPGAEPVAQRPAGLGIWALVLSLVALIVAPTLGAIGGFGMGIGLGPYGLEYLAYPGSNPLEIFSGVRTETLWAEIGFWIGTVAGLWAIVQGIIAAVQARGRVAAIIAIVVAVIAPFAYFIALSMALGIGAAIAIELPAV